MVAGEFSIAGTTAANNIALAWVLQQAFPTVALIGPASLAELRSTLPAVAVTLSEGELRWLNLDNSSKVRWCAALHIEMQRERWLRQGSAMVGYRSQARLLKSRWVYGIRSATVEIVFNGTVRAQETW